MPAFKNVFCRMGYYNIILIQLTLQNIYFRRNVIRENESEKKKLRNLSEVKIVLEQITLEKLIIGKSVLEKMSYM